MKIFLNVNESSPFFFKSSRALKFLFLFIEAYDFYEIDEGKLSDNQLGRETVLLDEIKIFLTIFTEEK